MALSVERLPCTTVILIVVPIKLFCKVAIEFEVVATLVFAVFKLELMTARLFVEPKTLALTEVVMLCDAVMDDPSEFSSVD